MKTNYEDLLKSMTDDELWILCNRMVEDDVMQCITSEAGLDGLIRNCCGFVEKIARIPVLGRAAVHINLFCGMLVDSCKKEYCITMGTKCTIIAALAYLVLPVDLIPDTIPFVGMLDDISVLKLAAGKLSDELAQYESYLAWKNKDTFRKTVYEVASERRMQAQSKDTGRKVVSMGREVV